MSFLSTRPETGRAFCSTAHRSRVEAAARALKHTLVEKPIATTLADGDAMIAEAEAANATRIVAGNMHFRPQVVKTVERIENGDIDEPLYMLARAGGIMSPVGWMRDKDKMGGDMLMDIGAHYVGALKLLMGEPDFVVASRDIPCRSTRA